MPKGVYVRTKAAKPYIRKKAPLSERLRDKQRRDEATGCLLFTGSKNKAGYGQLYLTGGHSASLPVLAHRLAAFICEIIPSLDDPSMVCHHCDNPACTEPTHLYRGDAGSNRRDAVRRRIYVNQNAGKTHCKNGHPLSGDNLTLRRRSRQCRICCLKAARDWKSKTGYSKTQYAKEKASRTA